MCFNAMLHASTLLVLELFANVSDGSDNVRSTGENSVDRREDKLPASVYGVVPPTTAINDQLTDSFWLVFKWQ